MSTQLSETKGAYLASLSSMLPHFLQILAIFYDWVHQFTPFSANCDTICGHIYLLLALGHSYYRKERNNGREGGEINFCVIGRS